MEQCLGPPCEHFPPWVKTREDALEYLNWRCLSGGTQINYVNDSALRCISGEKESE
jgi:hypothetical protein